MRNSNPARTRNSAQTRNSNSGSTRGRSASNRSAASSRRSSSNHNGNAAKSIGRTRAQATSKKSTQATNGNHSTRETVTHIAIPAVTGAIGVAGGLLLGRTALQRNPKVLGLRVPSVKVDLADVSKQVGAAARQFGRLANEVQQAREKEEQIGRAIS